MLVIGHFSARYTNLHVLLKEARDAFYPTWLAQELRPIFTDPIHERGILSPKVDLIDLTKKKPNSRQGYSKGPRSGGRPGGRPSGNKNFRPRKGRDGAPSGGNRGNYHSGGYQQRNDRYRQDGGYRGSSQNSGYRGSSQERGYRGSSQGGRDYSNSDRNNR